MQLNRNLKLIVVTILLLIAAALIYKKQKGTTLSLTKADFTISDISDIDKISITESEKTIFLEQDGHLWKIDQFLADYRKIDLALKSFNDLIIYNPVSHSELDQFTDSINKSGVIIKLYKKDKVKKTIKFMVSGNRNIAASDDEKQLYFIGIRGFGELTLDNIFRTEKNFWRDNILINFKAEDISKISLAYPAAIDKSFIIDNSMPQNPILKTIKNEAIKPDIVNKENIIDYLGFFLSITYAPLDTVNYSSGIRKNSLLFLLRIETIGEAPVLVEGYPLIKKNGTEVDNEKFMAIVDKTEVLQLDYLEFDPILSKIDYFYTSYQKAH